MHVLQLHVTIKRTFDICSEKKLKECSLIVVKMHVSMQSKVAADFFSVCPHMPNRNHRCHYNRRLKCFWSQSLLQFNPYFVEHIQRDTLLDNNWWKFMLQWNNCTISETVEYLWVRRCRLADAGFVCLSVSFFVFLSVCRAVPEIKEWKHIHYMRLSQKSSPF